MSNLQQKHDAFVACVSKFSDFIDAYAKDMPEDVQNMFSVTLGEMPHIDVSLRYVSEACRNNMLTFIGQLFGRDGWFMELEYDKEFFSWSKTILDCNITIRGAEPCPSVERAPVPPQKFPLALQNTEGVQPYVDADEIERDFQY